jgi:AraC family transcriptional regulator
MGRDTPNCGGRRDDPLPGVCDSTARGRGFVLERREVPAGEIGDTQYPAHLVLVERSPRPYRLSWRYDGVRYWGDAVPGLTVIRSQQVVGGVWMGGPQDCVALSIEPDAMELSLPEPFTRRAVELPPSLIGCDPFVNHLLAAMETELDGGWGSPLLIESLGKAVSVYVAGRFAANPFVIPTQRRGLDYARLKRVIEYIEAHVADDLSLEELSRIACLSSYHFGRMFKVSTGESVHRFVLRRRIERSKAMMARKELSLAEVAAGVGFCSQNQFSTMFRRVEGLPPGAWRRNISI